MIALSVVYDVQPGKMDAVLAALQRMKHAVSSGEPDCLTFQVSRVRGEENRLLLYEVYRDEQAFETHNGSPHFEAIVQGEIVPMLASRVRTVLDMVIA
jgi:quinol monooxygenase YgiN